MVRSAQAPKAATTSSSDAPASSVAAISPMRSARIRSSTAKHNSSLLRKFEYTAPLE